MSRAQDTPFAVRIVLRQGSMAAEVYRRVGSDEDELQRIAALSPLAFTAAVPMLRAALRGDDPTGHAANGNGHGKAGRFEREILLAPDETYYLQADWGVRIACFALVAAGLRDGNRLLRAADHLRYADPNETAWWLGLLTRQSSTRPLRALRILVEAVE
jgi:hypothetical protein